MKKTIVLLTTLLVVLFICSCTKPTNGAGDFTPDCSGAAKSFTTDVLPIIQSYCAKAGCHINGSTNGPGPITNYNQVVNAKSSIRSAIITGLMPQSGSLTATQKSKIICWIDAGASDN